MLWLKLLQNVSRVLESFSRLRKVGYQVLLWDAREQPSAVDVNVRTRDLFGPPNRENGSSSGDTIRGELGLHTVHRGHDVWGVLLSEKDVVFVCWQSKHADCLTLGQC